MADNDPLNVRSKEKVMQLRERDVHADLRILLVEDDVSSQRLTSHILIKNGMQVDLVTNGKDALSAILHRTYDVILMDVLLTGLSGLESGMDAYLSKPFQEKELVELIHKLSGLNKNA